MSVPVTQAMGNQLAEELLGLTEALRLRRLLDMVDLAASKHQFMLPVLVGLALRDRGELALAEYVLQVAEGLPGVRQAALFERAVVMARQGRSEEAVCVLRRSEAEARLSAYQQRFYALLLGELGRFGEAVQRVERALAAEPADLAESVAVRQFLSYQERFPHEQAKARTRALLDHHRFLGVQELVAETEAALRDGRGWCMIRLNDSEGAVLSLGVEDESDFQELYRGGRRRFHRRWFGHEGIDDPDWLRACAELGEALAEADCLGAYNLTHLEVRNRERDFQLQSSLFNVVRRLEQLRERRPEQAGEVALADPVIDRFLFDDGEIQRLLQGQDRIGLVTWNPDAPSVLAQRFGLKDVFFHQTYGERPPADAAGAETFGALHARLKSELAHAEPGVLYLVGAGVSGKVGCGLIKRAGGVALDLGTVIDELVAA